MAIRYAVATGNWSNVATWNGGASVPTTGDYVYANGYTVALDVNVNIGSGTLSTEICPTTSVGGGVFNFTTNRIIIGNIKAGTSTCVYSIADVNTTSTLYVLGNVDGTNASVCGIAQTVSSSKTNTVEIVGNISKYAVKFGKQSNSSRVSFSLTGNANTAGGYCLVVSYSSTLTYVVVNINGIVTGNSYEFADPAASATIGFGQLGTYTIVGGVVAETALKVIYCATAIVTGYIVNFGGALAVNASTSFQFTPTYYKIQDANGNDVILYPSTTLENPPDESDVRDGVVYGIGNAYTGTLDPGATASEIVAAIAASELGTKILASAQVSDISDVIEAIEAIPTPDPGASPAEFVQALKNDVLGQRLSKCSTVEITGEQIASYNV